MSEWTKKERIENYKLAFVADGMTESQATMKAKERVKMEDRYKQASKDGWK